MLGLSNSKFSIAIWAADFGRMHAILPRDNNHKIFNPIVLLIFNRTKRIFYSLVMHQFPTMKIATKVFCHYKAVFKNIAIFISHWIKEIVGVNLSCNVTTDSFVVPAFPMEIVSTQTLIATAPTLLAMQVKWFALPYSYPSFLTTVNAGMPYKFIQVCNLRRYLSTPFNLSKYWHNISIVTYQPKVRKGVQLLEA